MYKLQAINLELSSLDQKTKPENSTIESSYPQQQSLKCPSPQPEASKIAQPDVVQDVGSYAEGSTALA